MKRQGQSLPQDKDLTWGCHLSHPWAALKSTEAELELGCGPGQGFGKAPGGGEVPTAWT